MNRFFTPLLIAALLFTGCQREVSLKELPGVPEAAPAACNGDARYEFIKAEFGDRMLVFDKKWAPDLLYENVHIFNDGLQDQLNLIRFDSTFVWSAQLYFLASRLQQKTLPYTLPHSASAPGEQAELQFLNLKSPWYSQCKGCPDDDANYFGYTAANELSITISDTACSYLSGHFEGSVSTKTGKKLPVKNGSFTIKIRRVPSI